MSPRLLLDRIGSLSPGLRYGLLLLVALAAFLPGFTTLPPVDRDESRFAQATKQMVQSGDYIDIRFQDEPRHKKPAGIYWLQAVAVHLVGSKDEIWVYRLPSLLGALAAVLLTARIGGLMFGPGIGFGAGLVMATSVLLNVEARTAKTDAMLLAVILGAMACLLATIRRRGATEAAPGFWLLAGLGVLIKGPILFLPAAGLVAAQCWIRRGVRWLGELRPFTGIPLFLLVAAPWYVAITVISDGGFLAASVGQDMLAKVASGQESHGAPPGLHLALMPATLWPFSLLGLLALPWIWRRRSVPAVQLLLGWILLTWIVFEATPTKLAHYVLPAYPALAILAVAALHDLGEAAPRWWRAIAALIWSLVTIALGLAMPVLAHVLGLDFSLWQAAGILLLPALVAGLGIALANRVSVRQLATTGIAALLFSGIVFGQFLPSLEPVFVSQRLVKALPAPPDGCVRTPLASAGFTEPSLVFLTSTDTLLTTGAGAAAHLADGRRCNLAAVEASEEPAFLDRAAAIGETVRKMGEVTGFNYAKGKTVRIGIYSAADGTR